MIRLHYPEIGFKVENEKWEPEPFIERPHGFSGGGCFGITSEIGELRVIGYKLMGIQCSWSEVGGGSKVVPIKHLVEKLPASSR